MIPRAYITEWRSHAPWIQDAWVEQDLVISRAIVEIFRRPYLRKKLAFRGGTALYKLYLKPAVRYSEDIDLVQITPEPIGEVFDSLRQVLDPWLGKPRRQLKEGRVNLLYRFMSEGMPSVPIKLKIEINSREHFSHFGFQTIPFCVKNRWFSGETEVTTYTLNELLGTKLRALYQRKKGRDLFDLWYSFGKDSTNSAHIVSCFTHYMTESGQCVSRAQFEANLDGKRSDKSFRTDISPLLRPGIDWNFDIAIDIVLENLVAILSGDPWKSGK